MKAKDPLSETAEALQDYGEGHARGKVVITIRRDVPNAALLPD